MADQPRSDFEHTDSAPLEVGSCWNPQPHGDGTSSIARNVGAGGLALKPSDHRHYTYLDVPIPVYVWKKTRDDFTLAGFNKEAERLTSGRIREHLGIRASEYLRSDRESLENLYSCYERKTVLSREGHYEMRTTGEIKYLIIQWVFAPPDLVIVHILDRTTQKRVEEENEILAKFPDESPNPVIRVTRNSVIQYANPAAAEMLDEWKSSIGDSLPAFWSDISRRLSMNGASTAFELKVGPKTYLMTAHAVNKADAVYIYGNNITALKQAEKELELSARVFESTIEGIIITDGGGNIVSVNSAFTEITGYEKEQVVGQTPALLKSARHDEAFYGNILRSLASDAMWQGELWIRAKNGHVRPQWVAVNTVCGSSGENKFYVAVFNDISELKATQARIVHQAFHDPLTDMPNRLLFTERINQALKTAQQSGKQFALLYFDLDRFKNINDSFGHLFGDYILRMVAERLTAEFRGPDTVARLGGDEFVLLFSDIEGPADVFEAAERIVRAFRKPFHTNARDFFLTASIGVTIFPDHGEDSDTLVSNADLAMYHAKRLGGDRFRVFTTGMQKEVIRRINLENYLRRAWEVENFDLLYQPLVDAATCRLTGAEALLRWNDLGIGPVSPSEFIPLAEETGLILPLGYWVLERACRQVRQWRESGLPDVHVSVNVTARQLSEARFPEELRRILQAADVKSDALTVEITEDTLMSSTRQSIELLRELKETGVQISIDDFGTGYSSLSYLKRFPVDTLKIDRSFVFDLPEDKDSVAIVRSILALAKNLGLKVIAEGVETRPQLDFLTTEGCDGIQGFYFSRPVSGHQIMGAYPVGER